MASVSASAPPQEASWLVGSLPGRVLGSLIIIDIDDISSSVLHLICPESCCAEQPGWLAG
jgi:hypothetical protein